MAINVLTIIVNGVLRIISDEPLGFTFVYPVNIIIWQRGKLECLITAGRMNLVVDSIFIFFRRAKFDGIETQLYAYKTSVDTAVLIKNFTFSKAVRGPMTLDFLSNFTINTYSQVTFILREGGSFSNATSWPGFFPPSATFCKVASGCNLLIPSNYTLTTEALDGLLNIIFDRITITKDSVLQLGTPDSETGFRFQYSIRLDCYGTLQDVSGKSGGMSLPPGSSVNFFPDSSFISDVATSLNVVHRIQIDQILDSINWDTEFQGPVFYDIANSGKIVTSSSCK